MLEAHAASVGELIDQVKSIANTWTPTIVDPQELWFRGQCKARWQLLPGLYRPDIEKLHYDEIGLFERFKVLATPYVQRPPADDWEWYFLAQHYGLPTRLLDWTESLLAAAYFAIRESIIYRGRLAVDEELGRARGPSIFDDESPVIWVLDAGTLNRAASGDDYPFVPGGDLTAQYLPNRLVGAPASVNRLPLALLAPRSNERITAQQGTFTVHGHARSSLESIASPSEGGSTPIQLAKILLDRGNLSHLWSELELTGVTILALFPGVDTAAEHVKWVMQSAKATGAF